MDSWRRGCPRLSSGRRWRYLHDDGTNIDTGLMNTFARTPAIDLSGLAPGS